jgi:hypothetical protein
MRAPFELCTYSETAIVDADGELIVSVFGESDRAEVLRLLNAGANAAVEPASGPLADERMAAGASWAIVEIMGHRRLAGRISEHLVAGRQLLRVDCPGEKDGEWATQMYGAQSIFSITPCTEEVARQAAKQWRPEPVRLLAPGAVTDDDVYDEVGDGDDDDDRYDDGEG